MADDLDVQRFNGVNSNNASGENNGGSNVNSQELEALKQEILREMRKEVQRMKQDIIDGN